MRGSFGWITTTGLALLAFGATLVARDAPRVGEPFGPLVLPTVDGQQVIDLFLHVLAIGDKRRIPGIKL